MLFVCRLSGVVLCLLILSACQFHGGDMKANTMRAAIDNCRENNLGVLVFQRADRSIIAIRCIPLTDEVTHTVTLRKRVPLQLMQMFNEQFEFTGKN